MPNQQNSQYSTPPHTKRKQNPYQEPSSSSRNHQSNGIFGQNVAPQTKSSQQSETKKKCTNIIVEQKREVTKFEVVEERGQARDEVTFVRNEVRRELHIIEYQGVGSQQQGQLQQQRAQLEEKLQSQPVYQKYIPHQGNKYSISENKKQQIKPESLSQPPSYSMDADPHTPVRIKHVMQRQPGYRYQRQLENYDEEVSQAEEEEKMEKVVRPMMAGTFQQNYKIQPANHQQSQANQVQSQYRQVANHNPFIRAPNPNPFINQAPNTNPFIRAHNPNPFNQAPNPFNQNNYQPFQNPKQYFQRQNANQTFQNQKTVQRPCRLPYVSQQPQAGFVPSQEVPRNNDRILSQHSPKMSLDQYNQRYQKDQEQRQLVSILQNRIGRRIIDPSQWKRQLQELKQERQIQRKKRQQLQQQERQRLQVNFRNQIQNPVQAQHQYQNQNQNQNQSQFQSQNHNMPQPQSQFRNYNPSQSQQQIEQLQKPLEQYQIDNSQRRITEYIGQNSRISRNIQNQSQRNMNNNHPSQNNQGNLSSKDKQKNESDKSYSVVIKESTEKPRCDPNSFYKDNDIYGIDKQANSQRSQHDQGQNIFNIANKQFDISGPATDEYFSQPLQMQANLNEKPLQQESQQFDLNRPSVEYVHERLQIEIDVSPMEEQRNVQFDMSGPCKGQILYERLQIERNSSPTQLQNNFENNVEFDMSGPCIGQIVYEKVQIQQVLPSLPSLPQQSKENVDLNPIILIQDDDVSIKTQHSESQKEIEVKNPQIDLNKAIQLKSSPPEDYIKTTQVKQPLPEDQNKVVQQKILLPEDQYKIVQQKPALQESQKQVELKSPLQKNQNIDLAQQNHSQSHHSQSHPSRRSQQPYPYPSQAANQPQTNDRSISHSIGSLFPNIGSTLIFNQNAYPYTRVEITRNVVLQNITQTHSQTKEAMNELVQNERKHQTDLKTRQVKEVRFYCSKDGDCIFTEECFRDPLSDLNKVARITHRGREVGAPRKVQVQDIESPFYGRQLPTLSKYSVIDIKDNNLSSSSTGHNQPHALELQRQPSKQLSGVKMIYYRNEQDLKQILDYIDIQERLKHADENLVASVCFRNEEVMLEMKEQEVKQQSEKKERLKEEQEHESNMRWRTEGPVVRLHRMPEFLPHDVQQQQVQLREIDSFLPKPHPLFVQLASIRPTMPTADSLQNSSSKKRGRVTRLKQGKTGVRTNILSSPSNLEVEDNLESQSKLTKSKSIVVPKQPTGSLYHFEIKANSRSGKEKLIQVRRSGRIFSKSRALENQQIYETDEQSEVDTKVEQKGEQKVTKVQQKRKGRPKSKPKSQSKSKNKPQLSSTSQKPISRTGRKQNRDGEVTIDWLKQHISQLKQIVVDNVFMEDEFKAMTQKDAEISKFLYQLQRKNRKVKIQDESHKIKEQPKHKGYIKENEMMKQIKKQPQSKKPSNQSKYKSKKKNTKSLQKMALSKQSKIKIERTVQLSFKVQQPQKIQQPYYDEVKLEHNQQAEDILNYFNQAEAENRQLTQSQKIHLFNENKKKYRVPDEFPLTVREIIDPDILGLGIYALVRLGRVSEFQLGTPYAITPICDIRFARVKDVKAVLVESKKLVPQEYEENIALVALNSKLLKLIEKAKMDRSSDNADNNGRNNNHNNNNDRNINEQQQRARNNSSQVIEI